MGSVRVRQRVRCKAAEGSVDSSVKVRRGVREEFGGTLSWLAAAGRVRCRQGQARGRTELSRGPAVR
jgi:hypothetical protein